jgi:hypothetical protein
MTIPNPLVITVNAVAKNLPRINSDNYGSEYYLQETLQEFRVKIRHSREAKPVGGALQVERHNVELTHTVYATSTTPAITVTEYVVIRNDANNTAVNMGYINGALTGLLTSGFISDLRGWQS